MIIFIIINLFKKIFVIITTTTSIMTKMYIIYICIIIYSCFLQFQVNLLNSCIFVAACVLSVHI